MSWVRTPYMPPQSLVDGIDPRRPRAVRVVVAMLVLALAGPLVGMALRGESWDRGFWVLLGYDVAIAVIAAMVALRRPSRREVGWFVTLHQVMITTRNGPVIVDYLARTRRWRAYGVVASLGVGQGIVLASPGTQANTWALLFAGWFVGGILAELPVGVRNDAGVPMASLQRRTLSLYLSPGIVGWIIGWAALTVALLVVYGVTESPDGTRRVVAASAVLAALTFVSVWSMRVIVRRAQSAAPPEMVAADDATRRAAVRRIAAGWAVLQCMASVVVGVWSSESSGMPPEIGVSACFVGVLGVLASWLVVPTRMSPPPARLDGLVAS